MTVAVVVGMTVMPAGSALGASSPRWPVCGEWRQVTGPDLNSFQANAVATVSPTEAWMVGNLTPDGLGQPVALRWDGRRWVQEVFPTGSRNGTELNDVVALSSGEVWAVGARDAVWGFPPKGRPMAARWDGTRWRSVPVDIVGLNGSLTAVAEIGGTGDLWAVGHAGFGRAARPLAIRWDGSAWHRTPGPHIDRGPTSLADVVSVGRTAWAVGSIGDQDWTMRSTTLIERWNGTRWVRVASPNPGPRFDRLSGVDASAPDAVWAVGSFVRGPKLSDEHALVLGWDGGRWRVVMVRRAPSGLAAINVASPTDAWAVGEIGRRPLVVRRHGHPWRLSETPGVRGWFTGIDGTPHNQWASMVDMNGIEHNYGFTTSWHRC